MNYSLTAKVPNVYVSHSKKVIRISFNIGLLSFKQHCFQKYEIRLIECNMTVNYGFVYNVKYILRKDKKIRTIALKKKPSVCENLELRKISQCNWK